MKTPQIFSRALPTSTRDAGGLTYSAAPSFDLIPALDGLRALSVLLVVASHLGLEHVVPGGFGVTVFFFVSGFLITRQLLAERRDRGGRIAIVAFYMRRLLRLYPALFGMIVLGGLAFTLAGGQVSAPQLVAALLYVTNYATLALDWAVDPIHYHGLFDILWSLAVEEHFYLVFPLLVLLLGRSPGRFAGWLLAAMLGVTAWRWHVAGACLSGAWCLGGVPDLRVNWATDTRMDSLLAGAVLAALLGSAGAPVLLRLFGRRATLAAALLLLVASLVIREPTFRLNGRFVLQHVGLFLGVGALLFAPCWHPLRRLLSAAPARLLGRLSYSLYLWHWVVISVAWQATFGRMEPDVPEQLRWLRLSAPWIIALSLALAWLSYVGIERPMLRLRRRWGSRGVADAAV